MDLTRNLRAIALAALLALPMLALAHDIGGMIDGTAYDASITQANVVYKSSAPAARDIAIDTMRNLTGVDRKHIEVVSADVDIRVHPAVATVLVKMPLRSKEMRYGRFHLVADARGTNPYGWLADRIDQSNQ